MKYLNLSKGFNPYDAKTEDCIQFESFFFNGGEPHIKLGLNQCTDADQITITHRINSMNDLGLLLVAVDAIRRQYDNAYYDRQHIQLFLPYLPGARQDRVMVEGEALTVKIYCDTINSLNLDKIIIFDCHSDVGPSLLNNCNNLDNHRFVNKCINSIFNELD